MSAAGGSIAAPRSEPSGSQGRPAPSLRRGLALLHLLASRPGPLSAGAIARELGLARSTTYELLGELADAGWAVHLPQDRRWGLGLAAFEIGSAYLRRDPLERLGHPVLSRLGASTGLTAHLGILLGAQTLYLIKERPPRGGAPALVTEVGVRLPAALTATGLSILANLPAVQVRALFPAPQAFVLRTGRGARSLPQLRGMLQRVRRSGWAVEDGLVSPGAASVAAAVFDHNAMPVAAVGMTFAHECVGRPRDSGDGIHLPCGVAVTDLALAVRSATAALTAAIGGHVPAPARD